MEAQKFLRRWIAPCMALFAASTLYSQSVMDLFSTLLCLFCVYDLFWLQDPQAKLTQLKKWKVLFPKLFVGSLFLIWWIIVAIGLFLNDYQHAPVAKVLINFKWIFIWYVLVHVFRRVPVTSKQLFWSSLIVLTTTIYSLVLFFMKYDPGEDMWFESLASMRSGGVFYNPMTYAHSFAMILFVLLGAILGASFEKQPPSNKPPSIKSCFQSLWSTEETQWKSWFTFISFVLLFISVFLSMTRGVWAGIFVGLLMMAFLIRPLLGCVTTVLAGLSIGVLFMTWKTFADRIMHVFDYQNNYDLQRVTLWKANWQIFLDHPWFGMGYTENARRLVEYYAKMGIPEERHFVSHAHNQYLHMLAGTGVFGLVIFLSVLLFFLVITWKAWRLETQRFTKFVLLGCLSAQVCFHLGALTEANFEHSKVRFVLMLVWAFATARYLDLKGVRNENHAHWDQSGHRSSDVQARLEPRP